MRTMILDYYPPVIRSIKEIQQIAKAEDLEVEKLDMEIEKVKNNMFFFSADEDGIKRFEQLLGIPQNNTRSLEERKAYIFYMANRKKMSLTELEETIHNYEKELCLTPDYNKDELVVTICESVNDLKTIYEILDELLPLQVYVFFALPVTSHMSFREIKKKLTLQSAWEWWEIWEWISSAKLKTAVKLEESFGAEPVIMRKDLWYLDGTVTMDGSRIMDAEIKEETV